MGDAGSSVAQPYVWLDVDGALERIGDEGTLHDLLAMLNEMLLIELPVALSYQENQQWPELKSILHRWNGSLGHFVSAAFAKRVRELEAFASKGHSAQLEQSWQSCYADLQTLSAELQHYTSK